MKREIIGIAILLLLIASVGSVEAIDGGAIIGIYHSIDGETVYTDRLLVNGDVTGYMGAVITSVTVNGVNATGTGPEGGLSSWECWAFLHPEENSITVKAVDFLNRLTVKNITVNYEQTVFVSIDSHRNNETVYARNITVSGTTTATDWQCVKSVTVNEINATLDSVRWNANVSLYPGENTITVVAISDIGNSKTQTITVTVICDDSRSPKLYIDSPSNGKTVDIDCKNITISGHVLGVGGASVESIKVNDKLAEHDLLKWSVETSLHFGRNIITVVVTDETGNSTTKNIIVYRGFPLLIIDNPDNETVHSENIIILGGSCGVASVVISVTVNDVNATGTGPEGGLSSWKAVVFLIPGLNEITVTATDCYGSQTTKIITVIYEPILEVNVDVNVTIIDVDGNETTCTCNCSCKP